MECIDVFYDKCEMTADTRIRFGKGAWTEKTREGRIRGVVVPWAGASDFWRMGG